MWSFFPIYSNDLLLILIYFRIPSFYVTGSWRLSGHSVFSLHGLFGFYLVFFFKFIMFNHKNFVIFVFTLLTHCPCCDLIFFWVFVEYVIIVFDCCIHALLFYVLCFTWHSIQKMLCFSGSLLLIPWSTLFVCFHTCMLRLCCLLQAVGDLSLRCLVIFILILAWLTCYGFCGLHLFSSCHPTVHVVMLIQKMLYYSWLLLL